MKSQRVTFAGALGHDLAARVDRDEEAPGAWALFAHCFTCSKDLKAVGRISRALVQRGFGVLRFDFTGLGDSEGDFGATSFTSNLGDLRAAVDWLRSEHAAPSLLVGHSLGGAAVLSMAAEVEECRAVATLAAPSTTEHIRDTLFQASDQAAELADDEADAEESVQVTLAGRSFRIQKQMLDDLESHRVLDRVAELSKPLLICHSPLDGTVGIDHARRIFEAAKHPKSFVSLDRADHLLLKDPADAAWVADLLSSWASRYLDVDADAEDAGAEDEAPKLAESNGLGEGDVEVVGTDGYAQRVRTGGGPGGGHRLVADEPERLGGTDTGPTPYDFLLAALGACTNITLRMYADRKGWPLERVISRLSHESVHAKDCQDCLSEKGKISIIEREIRLDGDDLDDEQLDRLMEIADRCPVHRTLTSEIKIRSRRHGAAAEES